MTRPPVALAHDYLTQLGGAERVVLALSRAFPGAPLHTTVHESGTTYAELDGLDVHTTPLQRVGPFRRNPRLALPLLAPAAGHHRIDADVTVCNTTGWAHGMPVTGAKVVYAHNTPRWLYQRDEYLANLPRWYGWGLTPLHRPLLRWDRRAAASADEVVAGSVVARERIRRNWGRDAEVVYPPPGLAADGERQAVDAVEPGYLLTVARLLPYKRVDVVVDAVAARPGSRLVVVGDGPDRERLAARVSSAGASDRIRFLTEVSDPGLRWLYENAAALVTAAQEDFGLTPLEAMGFGTPVVAIDAGGFRETVVDEVTGLLFATPDAVSLGRSLDRASSADWPKAELVARAEAFSEASFAARFHEIVASVRADSTR
jgi:glycosyltransferase involved in cell wall biosynthesis